MIRVKELEQTAMDEVQTGKAYGPGFFSNFRTDYVSVTEDVAFLPRRERPSDSSCMATSEPNLVASIGKGSRSAIWTSARSLQCHILGPHATRLCVGMVHARQ